MAKTHLRLILILDKCRGKDYGTLLINQAKEIAEKEEFREIILETQSCNSKAVEFYTKDGFKINGIDFSSYTNNDVEKKEVRLEMVYRVDGDFYVREEANVRLIEVQ